MQVKTLLIRHGQTPGNLERRYIGCRTDEALCVEGREALKGRTPPEVARVFVSPMRRALETAQILYPNHRYEIVEDFRECDFGQFEGKNFTELNGNEDYQRWLDSGGELPFPGGESRAGFANRCVQAYASLCRLIDEDAALIVHGGTIMAIMAQYARPRGEYFDFQLKNGEGFVLFKDGQYERLHF